MTTFTTRLRARLRPTDRDPLWSMYTGANGAHTCCGHCPAAGCDWQNWHPAPCRKCIRELEQALPMRGCTTDHTGHCTTCEQLHGVRVTHRGPA